MGLNAWSVGLCWWSETDLSDTRKRKLLWQWRGGYAQRACVCAKQGGVWVCTTRARLGAWDGLCLDSWLITLCWDGLRSWGCFAGASTFSSHNMSCYTRTIVGINITFVKLVGTIFGWTIPLSLIQYIYWSTFLKKINLFLFYTLPVLSYKRCWRLYKQI